MTERKREGLKIKGGSIVENFGGMYFSVVLFTIKQDAIRTSFCFWHGTQLSGKHVFRTQLVVCGSMVGTVAACTSFVLAVSAGMVTAPG